MPAPDLYGIDPDCLYPWKPSEDPEAPIILLAPLDLKLSARLDAANQKRVMVTARHRREAFESAAKEGKELDTEALTEVLVDAWDACYPDDLKEAILAHVVKGWEGLKRPGGKEIPFTGNLAALTPRVRGQIFLAVATETAWEAEAREGFGSRPASLSE